MTPADQHQGGEGRDCGGAGGRHDKTQSLCWLREMGRAIESAATVAHGTGEPPPTDERRADIEF